jgi:hypothetical protein
MSTTGCNPCKGLTAATTGSLSSSDADTSEHQMSAVISGMWFSSTFGSTHGEPQQAMPLRQARLSYKLQHWLTLSHRAEERAKHLHEASDS